MKVKRDWVSTSEAAKMIGYSENTVRRLTDAGPLKSFTIIDNGWRRIDRASVDAYLKRRRNGDGKKR